MNEDFINKIVWSILDSERYEDNYQKYYDLQTFRLVVEKFNVESYLENLTIDRDTYNEYFKDIVKKYDFEKHKEVKKELKESEKRKSNQTPTNILGMNDNYSDRDRIFESVIDGDYYENDDCKYVTTIF